MKYLILLIILSSQALWAGDKFDILYRTNAAVYQQLADNMALQSQKHITIWAFLELEKKNMQLLIDFEKALKLPEGTRGKVSLMSKKYDAYKDFADDIIQRAAKGVALCQPLAGYAAVNLALVTDLYAHTDLYDLGSFKVEKRLLTDAPSPAFDVFSIQRKI